MATRRIAVAELAVALAVACALVSCKPKIDRSIGFGSGHWAYPATLDSVVPTPMQRTIAGSDRVEIALAYGQGTRDLPGEKVGPRGEELWSLRSPWKALSPDRAASLRRILLGRKSWQTEIKPCTFNPNVAFRWSVGSDTAGALLCHSCDELIGWQGSVRMGGEVDPAGDSLLSLTSAVFPDDSLLQAIVTRKHLRY